MSLNVNIAGAWKDVVTPSVNVGGVWKTVAGIAVNVDGVWKTVFGAITPSAGGLHASINASSVSGARSDAGVGTTSAATVTVDAGTGTAPYTYAWSRVSGSVLTIDSPTAASTTFSYTLANGESVTARYKCIITDAVATTFELQVDVAISSTYVAPIIVTVTKVSGPTEGGGFGAWLYSFEFNAAITGGNGSYSYSWGLIIDDPSPFTSLSGYPSGANETIDLHSPGQHPTYSGTITCTVHDTAGRSASGSLTFNQAG